MFKGYIFFCFLSFLFTPFNLRQLVLKPGSLSYGKLWKLKFAFQHCKSYGISEFWDDNFVLADGWKIKKFEKICVKLQNIESWNGSATYANFEVVGFD